MKTQSRPLSNTEHRILMGLARIHARSTEHLAIIGGCSLGRAVEVLLHLEREGLAARGPVTRYGMTWRRV